MENVLCDCTCRSEWWRKKENIVHYVNLALNLLFLGQQGRRLFQYVLRERWKLVTTSASCVLLFVIGLFVQGTVSTVLLYTGYIFVAIIESRERKRMKRLSRSVKAGL